MTATFSLSKVLTIVTETMVYNVNFSEFENEIANFSEVTIKGWVDKSKYNKYVSILKSKGFNESVISYCDAKKDNSIDFRIKYVR